MTAIEATTAPSLPSPASGEGIGRGSAVSPPSTRIVAFRGNVEIYWRLLIRGAVLLMVTLGIYRFWLITDIRRFLWANTEIAGHSFEYNGTARELLIGFLIALAILVPINVIFFIAALSLGLVGQLSAVGGFIALIFLGHFAVYRARRYRLTRTIYRGVRFHQTGSALRYAVRAMLWWTLIALTLGLAYPWAQASLERFKMRHTHYGNLRGRFESSGTRLFLRGLLMWLLVMGPILAAVVTAIGAIDPDAIAEAARDGGRDVVARIEATNPGFYAAVAFGISAIIWGMIAAMVLYPAFQALTIRWWAAGLRFGEVTVQSELRTSQIYGAYLRFLLYTFAFGIIGVIMVGMAAGSFTAIFKAIGSSQLAEFAGVGLALLGYVIFMLGYSTIYQVVVKLAIWRFSMESLELTGLASLDKVTAAGEPGSAIGEGLADALDVGGF